MAIGLLTAGVNASDNTASTGQDVADTVNYLQLWLNSGSGSASENHSKITAALSSARVVVLNCLSSDIYVDDTIIVPSGKSLKTAHGTNIKMASGANKMVICNEGLLRPFSAATVNWNLANGRKFTVDWTAHGLSVGDGFCIQGAAPVTWNTVYVVAEVNSVNQITSYAYEIPSAQPSAAINIKSLDSDIEIYIKGDYNARGGNAGTVRDLMGSVFAFIKDSEINIDIDDTLKYASQISGCLNVSITCKGNTKSDIMKFYGASRGVRGRVYGTSHDDCFSIQAKEPAAYIAYQPAVGPISDIIINGFDVRQIKAGQSHGGGIVIYSDNEHLISGVKIMNGYVSDSSAAAMRFASGETFTPTSPLITDVLIENVELSGNAAVSNIICATQVGSIEIVNPTISNSVVGNKLLELASSSVVGSLVVDGWVFDSSSYTTGTTYFLNLQGPLDNFLLKNSRVNGSASGASGRLVQITAAVKSANIYNCGLSRLNQVCFASAASSASLSMTIESSNVSDCGAAFITAAGGRVLLINSNFNSITSGAAHVSASGVSLRVYDYGSSYASANPSGAAGSQLIPMTPTTPVNINAGAVVKTIPGQFGFNTTAAGTIPANRPVVCDGTNWRDMTNLSNLF